MNATIDEATYTHYLAALLAGDRESCAETVQALLKAGTGLKPMYVGLLQRAQYQVGELWEQEKMLCQ